MGVKPAGTLGWFSFLVPGARPEIAREGVLAVVVVVYGRARAERRECARPQKTPGGAPMFNPYADDKYQTYRYGELLEAAARARLAHAAEAPRRGWVARVTRAGTLPVWRLLRAVFGGRVAADRPATARPATFPGGARLARGGR